MKVEKVDQVKAGVSFVRDGRLSIKLGLEDTTYEKTMAGGACHDTRAGHRSEQIRKRGRLSKRSKMSEVQGAWKVLGSSCIDGSEATMTRQLERPCPCNGPLSLQRSTGSPLKRGGAILLRI